MAQLWELKLLYLLTLYSEDLLLHVVAQANTAERCKTPPRAQLSSFVGLRRGFWGYRWSKVSNHIYLLLALSPTASSASELLKSLPSHLPQQPAHLASTPNFQFTHYLTIITKINNPPKLIMFFPMLQPSRQNLI